MKNLFIFGLLFLSSQVYSEWHSSQLWFKDYNNPYPNTNYTYQLHSVRWHFHGYDVAHFNDVYLSPPDRIIGRSIREIIQHSPDAENIAIFVENGLVTLRGTISDREVLTDFENKIQDIEGVTKVCSQIIVYVRDTCEIVHH